MGPTTADPDSPLQPLPLARLKGLLQAEIDRFKNLQCEFDSFDVPLDSSSIAPADWLTIATRITRNYEAYDGFVVIHGTDTLAYTASALSFLFDNLAKPVVVTGSQVPLLAPDSDAAQNFRHALAVASAQTTAGDAPNEVAVVFGGRVLRGCRTRKMSAALWQAFDTPNCAYLGSFSKPRTGTVERFKVGSPAPVLSVSANVGSAFRCAQSLEPGVVDLTVVPGLQGDHLRVLLGNADVRGAVLRVYGTGNVPETPEFVAALKDALLDRGKVAIAVSQCPHGGVDIGRYGASLALQDCGVICGYDITAEAALTKLMVVLASNDANSARDHMMRDLRGEMSLPHDRNPSA